MEKMIYEKLNKISDLDDRVLLKNIMNSVFSSLEDYTKDRYDNLEKRIFDEIPYREEKYNIYSTIVKKEKLNPIDDFMYPILEEDTEEVEYDTKDIILNLNNNVMQTLFKVFVKSDYLTFCEFLNDDHKFKGIIETDKKVHEAYFKVKKNNQYTNKIKNLYKAFINNNIKWTTINNPYINKIADVILVGCRDEIDSEESILKIDIDFGEYSKYIQYNMVPLWNVKELSVKCDSFPVPCVDKVNYEHNISIVKQGINNGYLVNAENEELNYVIFKKDSVVISSKKDISVKWNLLKIINYETKSCDYENELMSNKINVNFSNRMSLEKRYTIKTKSELIRAINSFEASKYLKFKDVFLEKHNFNNNKEAYEVNDFIIDEIREEDIKKNLILQFEPLQKDNYLNNDILSFLVSEIQMLYPEYECVGKLI